MELNLNKELRETLLSDVKSLSKDLDSLQAKLEAETPVLTERDVSALTGVLEGKKQLVTNNLKNLHKYSEDEQEKLRTHYRSLINEIDAINSML